MRKRNLIGYKTGWLEVVAALPSILDKAGIRRVVWLCKCKCGGTATVRAATLIKKAYKSCGCYREEFGIPKWRHGKCSTKLYLRWVSMKSRCANPEDPYYGSRGVTVCQEWAESFPAFEAWAISTGYDETLELDRKNRDGNYTPDNCRWVTHQENCQNRRPRRYAKMVH